jgi:hypothetical protein
MVSYFKASKTRSDRPGWSVTFRHPMRTDSRGQLGLKVRRGLGTEIEAEADELIEQLNELLKGEVWWTGDKRKEAEKQFSPVIVSAFFDGIEAVSVDNQARRNTVIELPGHDEGYSQVLFLGTTGAGKTTLLRHMIGSDPVIDRFPSTSTAKTTTADIEIVLSAGPFSAAVTFTPEHEARANVDECLEEACLEAVQGRSDSKIMSAFLQHREQRFRLSYILGSWSEASGAEDSEFSFEDDEDASFEIADDEIVPAHEHAKNLDCLRHYLNAIKSITADVEKDVVKSLGSLHDLKAADDRAAWLEIFGNSVFQHHLFGETALDVVEDILDRFKLIPEEHLERSPSDWPLIWSYSDNNREKFLSLIRWFSSNHHKQFGRLLTPLVDGIRVKGPFASQALAAGVNQKLVLLDGQGLGHTATTASSISTRVTQRFETVDMILLVDNAQQPMQAAPLALMRAIGTSGFTEKLAISFTHFDQVKGANLGSFAQKREHVIGSVTNAIASLRDTVGAGVAGALDRQIERSSVFLGGLDRPTNKLPGGFLKELERLFILMIDAADRGDPVECGPIYEIKGLEVAMRDAIEGFRDPWRARLGLDYREGIPKEHWTRVKALTRRFANKWANEYGDLKPVADLIARLQEEVSRWLDNPSEWARSPKDDEEREAALGRIRQAVFARLSELVARRLSDEQVPKWRMAYDFWGTGSATMRANLIDNIHDYAAPQIRAAMTSDARNFLSSLHAILLTAINIGGGSLRAIGHE